MKCRSSKTTDEHRNICFTMKSYLCFKPNLMKGGFFGKKRFNVIIMCIILGSRVTFDVACKYIEFSILSPSNLRDLKYNL